MTTTARTATYAATCTWCGDWIIDGQTITHTAYGWVHRECT